MSDEVDTNRNTDGTDVDSRLKELQQENELLRERLTDIEAAILEEPDDVAGPDDTGTLPVSRRGALAGMAGLGLLGVGATGSASANEDLYGTLIEGDGETNALDVRNHNSDAGSRAVIGRTTEPNTVAFVGHSQASAGGGDGLEGRTSAESGRGLFGVNDHPNPNDDATGVHALLQPWGDPVIETSPAALHAEIWGDEIAEGAEPVCIRAEVDVDNGAERAIGIESDGKAVIHDDLEIDSGGEIHIEDGGHLNVSGTKHFVHAVETPTGNKKVRYTSVEAGKALTEVSEVAEMEDGRAEIELPEHFGMVTSDEEPLSVQVTPYANEEVQPQVVEQSTDCIVVEDFSDTDYDYTFAYTVKGVREGFEDEEIVVDDE